MLTDWGILVLLDADLFRISYLVSRISLRINNTDFLFWRGLRFWGASPARFWFSALAKG